MQIYGGNKYLQIKSNQIGPILQLEFRNITGVSVREIRIIPFFPAQFETISEIPPFSLEPFKSITKDIAFENSGDISGFFLIIFQDETDLLSIFHQIHCSDAQIKFGDGQLWETFIQQNIASEIKIPPSKDSGQIFHELTRRYTEIPLEQSSHHLFVTVKQGLGIILLYPTKIYVYTHEPKIYDDITQLVYAMDSITRESLSFTLGYRMMEFQTILQLETDTGMLLNRLSIIIQVLHELNVATDLFEQYYNEIDRYQLISQISDTKKQEIMTYLDKFVNQFCHPLTKVYPRDSMDISEIGGNSG